MFYYLYKITNRLNSHVYVGVHKTSNLDDGYMGSGTILRAAYKKHGVENFDKTILEFFVCEEEMFAREREMVTDEFIQRADTYNARRGGTGGFDYVNKIKTPEERRELGLLGQRALQKRGTNRFDPSYVSAFKNKSLQQELNERSRTTAAITKRKRTFGDIRHQQGKKNNQYGTCWIWHELIGVKKCKVKDLPLYIDQGWHKGRRMM